MGDLVAQSQGLLQRGTAQVQITVFQTQGVVDRGLVADLKGRGVGLFVDFQAVGQDLNAAGGDLVIDGRALAHHAFDLQSVFRTNGEGQIKQLFVVGLVKDALDDAFPIPQVDEDQAAQVPHTGAPAADGDPLPDVLFSQGAAVMPLRVEKNRHKNISLW